MKTKRLLTPTSALWLLPLLLVAAAVRPALAQAPFPQDCPEELDENGKLRTYSLYYEEFKNGNYQAALPNLRLMLRCAPTFPEQAPHRNFERAITAYDSLSARATDPALTTAYADSALLMFDAATATFDAQNVEYDAFEWVFEKARFIQSRPERLVHVQDQVMALYEQAYELDPQRLGGYGDGYYLNVLIGGKVQQYQSTGDLDIPLSFMEEIEATMGDNLGQPVVAYIDQIRDALLKNPEDRIAYLKAKLEKEPTNQDVLTELFDLYRTEGYRDEMYELGAQLLEMKPSFVTYRLLGTMYLQDGEIDKALELFDQAAAQPDANLDANFYYNMGSAYQQKGNLSQARAQYRKALQADASFSKANEAIGDLYVQAVADCGSSWRDRAVYWLAVDYYNKAGASQKASTYRRYFPSTEDKFMNSVNDGATWSVDYGCYGWIGETTTVK